MSSLTIRLDPNTDALLSQLSELLQQNKSTLAREGIARYLEEQLASHQAQQKLAAQIDCSDKEAVMQRIAESEAGPYLTDEEYERSMDEFFAKELGLVR
ncbi:MAG: ribbon-helix-helix protein, CopG family [Gammaproteobacteria bacterium]|nr:ribbon-helix-helix protein, CopG family [Gammaproteobacteria bacterium]